MKWTYVLVAIGGMIGAVMRYSTASYFSRLFHSSFPYGTFAANIIGCFAIGLIYGLSGRVTWFNREWSLFLATGVCGGYTTFSSFTYENLQLLQNESYAIFGLYSLLSFALGLSAAYVGLMITKI